MELQEQQYSQQNQEPTYIEDGIDHDSPEWMEQYGNNDFNLENCRVLRASRYGTSLALDDVMETGEHTENYNIFNYIESVKVNGIDITKPEGYEANGEPITEPTATYLLQADPTNPYDLEQLLNNFDELHLKDGTIIWSETYFEEHIKPTLSEEELNQIIYIDNEELKELLLNQEQAIDLYSTADASDIAEIPEYQSQFDEWAAHIEEEAEAEDKQTALEIAEAEDREAEREADFNFHFDIDP